VSSPLYTAIAPPYVLFFPLQACIVAQDDKSGTTTRPAKSNQLMDSMNTARQIWGRWFGDLYRAWWVILISAVGVGLVFGFVWLLVAKWCTSVFVWGTITLLIIVLSFLTGYFYYKGNLINITVPSALQDELNQFQSAASGLSKTVSYIVPQSFDSVRCNHAIIYNSKHVCDHLMSVRVQGVDSQTAYRVVAYVFTAITLIVVAIIIAVRRSIATAVRVIKLGAESLQHLPSLVFFPLTTVVAITAFMVRFTPFQVISHIRNY
jgi:energy-coupling factor transporter transmembrane protein EcfT